MDLRCGFSGCNRPAEWLSAYRTTRTWEPRCNYHVSVSSPYIGAQSLPQLARVLTDPTYRNVIDYTLPTTQTEDAP